MFIGRNLAGSTDNFISKPIVVKRHLFHFYKDVKYINKEFINTTDSYQMIIQSKDVKGNCCHNTVVDIFEYVNLV